MAGLGCGVQGLSLHCHSVRGVGGRGRGGEGGESLTCDEGTKARRMWWEMGQGCMMMLMMCFIQ